MKKLIRLLAFLRPQAIFPIPQGIVPDNVGMWGLFGLMGNVNNYAESLSSVVTSGTAITLVATGGNMASLPGNVLSGFTRLDAGASGALTATMPATAAILSALGATIPQDGSYTEPVYIANNSGQTVTLAAGDANTTMIGSAVIAVGGIRKLLLRVLNSSNVSFTNAGFLTL